MTTEINLTYTLDNQNVFIGNYQNGKAFLPEVSIMTGNKKDVLGEILDAITPEGKTNVIYAKPALYTGEVKNRSLSEFSLFFITEHESKCNFFEYKFNANNRVIRSMMPPNRIVVGLIPNLLLENIHEKSETDFFNQISNQSELKELFQSFKTTFGKIKLYNELNEDLIDTTTKSHSHKI